MHHYTQRQRHGSALFASGFRTSFLAMVVAVCISIIAAKVRLLVVSNKSARCLLCGLCTRVPVHLCIGAHFRFSHSPRQCARESSRCVCLQSYGMRRFLDVALPLGIIALAAVYRFSHHTPRASSPFMERFRQEHAKVTVLPTIDETSGDSDGCEDFDGMQRRAVKPHDPTPVAGAACDGPFLSFSPALPHDVPPVDGGTASGASIGASDAVVQFPRRRSGPSSCGDGWDDDDCCSVASRVTEASVAMTQAEEPPVTDVAVDVTSAGEAWVSAWSMNTPPSVRSASYSSGTPPPLSSHGALLRDDSASRHGAWRALRQGGPPRTRTQVEHRSLNRAPTTRSGPPLFVGRPLLVASRAIHWAAGPDGGRGFSSRLEYYHSTSTVS